MTELLYENWFERFYSLLLDLLIFFAKSIYYTAESLYLTLLPDRFRKIKVSAMNFCDINRDSNWCVFVALFF